MSEANGKRPAAERCKVLQGIRFDVFQDAEGKKAFPLLHDLLSPRWKDGVCTRQGAKIRVFVEAGNLRVALEAPTEGVQAIVTVGGMIGVFEALETALTGGKISWGLSWKLAKKNLPEIDAPIQ